MNDAMLNSKSELLEQLDAARDALWQALDALERTADGRHCQRVQEIFAHIAGWEALVFEAFRNYCFAIPASDYSYAGIDAANAEFVSKRQALSVADARRECEVSRFAIRAMLDVIPAEHYDDAVRFPWGEETVTEFVRGAIDHEQLHRDEATTLMNG